MTEIVLESVEDAASREALLDLCLGEGRKAKSSERLREGRLPADGLAFSAHGPDGRLAGTVRLWNVTAGPARPALLLGPLAVHPWFRARGLGGDMMRAYYKRLTSKDRKVRRAAAKAWSVWEGTTSKLYTDPALVAKFGGGRFADAFARIECHYFVNKGFFDRDDQLLRDSKRLRHIPAVIVQGRYDVVCPARSAWDLHRAWPEAKLIMVHDAGHSMTEPGIRSALIEETERFVRL